MHFGFSLTGLLMLAMLFIPNLLWTKNKPADYDRYAGQENRALQLLERVGQAAVTTLSLVFADFNAGAPRPWSLWLLAAFVLMLLYEVWWVRYFRSARTMRDFYTSLLGIPLAGSTLPVMAFFLLAVYGKNILLGAASVILGIGHIGIHRGHWKSLR